ncbi:MAG: sulfatase [Alphaproteobacteria bacterium]|nr:sulfatase [Alphaproteobacteria bacterium]
MALRDPAAPAGRFAPALYRAEDSDTAFLTDALLAYLRERRGRPWFAHFSCLKPHPPLVAPAPYHRHYNPAAVPLPKRRATPAAEGRQHPWLAWAIAEQTLVHHFNEDLRPEAVGEADERAMRATYYGLCNEVDDNIGRVIADLKESGAYQHTLIVFTSDHGDQLGDHWLYGRNGYFDPLFHVPLIIRDPRAGADRARGRRVDRFTEAVDLMPTILAALALPVPEQCDGYSLLPFLRGETPADWRNAARFECDFRDLRGHAAETGLGLAAADCNFAVLRGDRYKYVHFAALPPLFFDLAADPDEFEDRAADPAFAPRVLAAAQAVLSWRQRHAAKPFGNTYVGYDGVRLTAART